MAIVINCMATMLGTVVVLPIHLQTGLDVSALTTGLLLPGGLVQDLLSTVIGRIYNTVGPHLLVIPGALLLCGGQWRLSTLWGRPLPRGLVAAMFIGAAPAAAGGAARTQAQALGTQDAFVLGGCLGIIAVVCAPFVRRLRQDADREVTEA